LRFEIRYPSGVEKEVELQGSLVVVGRDTSCDLVLEDHRCSRRHAELEAGPQGIVIRDTGSANGVFVNGRKVDRASLEEGDVVQLGEVHLQVLGEEYPSTEIMVEAPELEPVKPPPVAMSSTPTVPSPPAPGPPPPPVPQPQAAPQEPPAERPSGPLPRPMTLSLLAALQVFSAVLVGTAGLILALVWRSAPVSPLVLAGGGILAMVVGIATGVGLWTRSGWARLLQIALAGLAVLSCAFLPLGAAVLLYMFRKETRLQFSGRADLRLFSAADARALQEDPSDTAFVGAVLGGLFLGCVLSIVVALVAGGASELLGLTGRATATPAVERLEEMVSAQDAFHMICDAGYADVEGLVDPSSAIPYHSADGPSFLPERFRMEEEAGYRFDLWVGEPLPAASEGCPTRAFRSYSYSASPMGGSGPHFVVGPDGEIRVAEDRAATLDDPPYRSR
jgi:hypothetical protein